MERVRSGRPQHVAAPPAHAPAPGGPVQLSKEQRQQLRVVKHHAFQRHQQNAMWTRDIFVFDGTTFQVSPVHRHNIAHAAWTGTTAPQRLGDDGHQQEADERERRGGDRSSRDEEARLRGQIDAKAREIESMKQHIAQVEHEQQQNQQRFEELMAGLKSIADRAALASFQERVQQERVHLFPAPTRELEIVKL